MPQSDEIASSDSRRIGGMERPGCRGGALSGPSSTPCGTAYAAEPMLVTAPLSLRARRAPAARMASSADDAPEGHPRPGRDPRL